MEILEHFEEKLENIIILALKDDEWDKFLAKLPKDYKNSYIKQEELESRIKNFNSTKENELSEILPDLGNIKSGDFGEILSFYLFKERYKKQNVNGPKKWRWKQEKNIAAPYTDGILFSIKTKGTPSKEDLLISIESKMKATPSKTYHPLQNAIDGVEKDNVSRIANSLSWLRKKYKDESLKEKAQIQKLKDLVDMIERYIKSETYGEYTKQLKAIAIVDKKFLDDEIKKNLNISIDIEANLEIVIVSINDLKIAYEKVFAEILKL